MMLKWSHATDITNMGQINYYFLQCSYQNTIHRLEASESNKHVFQNNALANITQ